MTETSHEAWILMSLTYRNLDDEDISDALMLAERLYGIDKSNSFYQFLYAKCLFRQSDYMASYGILNNNSSIPCLYLFAKSCLELGNMEEEMVDKRRYWEEGVEALIKLLKEMGDEETYWGDELSSVTCRQHTPSIASVHLLLGDLYVKIDHMRPASIQYKACLEADPLKLSAFIKLCDIAPDCFPLNADVTRILFKPMERLNTDKKSSSFLPHLPEKNVTDITFVDVMPDRRLQSYELPRLRKVFRKTTLDELKAVATRGSLRPTTSFDASERSDIEKRKDGVIRDVEKDIKQMKIREEYKNKHGLHKKPPVILPQQLKIDLTHDNEENQQQQDSEEELSIPHVNASSDKPLPPRLSVTQGELPNQPARKKHKSIYKEKHHRHHSEKNDSSSFPNGYENGVILKAMNTILDLFRLLADAYMYQSLNECRETTLQLMKLDDGQYSTPWVVSMIGKAYYNSGDYNSASLFFDYNFVQAPWYCETIPFYTTCLWYLEKKSVLNLVAYKMKNNKCHKYEAYIAAGNWTKLDGRANETIDWFKKAVEYDPSRYYGYALLGYEELEKEDYLAAKEYCTACMISNKQSYLGWFGLAKAFQGLRTYEMAETLLYEAVRLHPHHPVILCTMAEVLMELQKYDAAYQFITKSVKINPRKDSILLQEKIKLRIEDISAEE